MMTTTRKPLFSISIALLILALAQIVNLFMFAPTFNAIDPSQLDATGQAILPILNVIFLLGMGISSLILAFLGLKGILESRSPSGARFHIILAIIAAVFSTMGLINGIVDLFSTADFINSLTEVLVTGAHTALLIAYSIMARKNRSDRT